MIQAYNLGALFDAELGADSLGLIDCLDWENPRQYTHRQIDDLAGSCARGLIEGGLERGDPVAILSANRAEYLIAYLAILRAGMIAVPISYKFPSALVDYVLHDCGAKTVIVDEAWRLQFTLDLALNHFTH